MITRKLIKDGIKTKLSQFVVDPNMESGTVCQIGDSWFYFGGLTAEELNPEEYTSCIPEDDFVSDIFDTLDYFCKVEELKDEYEYYEAVLTYSNNLWGVIS